MADWPVDMDEVFANNPPPAAVGKVDTPLTLDDRQDVAANAEQWSRDEEVRLRRDLEENPWIRDGKLLIKVAAEVDAWLPDSDDPDIVALRRDLNRIAQIGKWMVQTRPVLSFTVNGP